MRRIGVYGGTFNPPHAGHIQAARQAIQALELDQLLLIPTRLSPHKQLPENSPTPEQRLDMLALAVDSREKMTVSHMELDREGPSYTWQTIAQLKKEHPQDRLYLLMGTDMFLSFLEWKRPEAIWADAHLAVVYRGQKGEEEAVARQKKELEKLGAKVHLVKNDITAISSTQMRRLLAFGCADAFLPEGLGGYIRQQGLYHTQANWKHLPMEQLEQVVICLLNPNRVQHVLGCRDTAVDLARHWGADVTDAARAGILHDITKALDGPLQLTLCQAYGKILDDFSRKYPKTIHALTGALVAQRIFGENPAVVSAIASHTTGKANMNLLEMIIYVADYMEPNRAFPGVEKLRELAYSDIEGALRLGLEMTLEHLKNQGSEVSPASREALDYLTCKNSKDLRKGTMLC